MTDPARQIRALRREIDALDEHMAFKMQLAEDVEKAGDAAMAALLELDVACLEECTRQRTLRLQALVKAHPDVEATP